MDHLYESIDPIPSVETANAGGGGDTELQIASSLGPPYFSGVAYLGAVGTTVPVDAFKLYEDNNFVVSDATPLELIAGDALVDIPAALGGGTQTVYPAALVALTTGTLPKITVVGSATVHDIDIDANLTGAALGVSIMNYSHLIRRE